MAEPPAGSDELQRYETHARVFAQVDQFHTSILTTVNVYVAVTGGFWAVIVPNVFHLPVWPRVLALTVHALISLAVIFIMRGYAFTIVQRLEFLRTLGEKYWKSIEAIGKAADLYAKNEFHSDRWSLRKSIEVWKWGPGIGAIASVVLAVVVWVQGQTETAACSARVDHVMKATTALELDRAKFLMTSAGCDVRGMGSIPPR